MLSLVTKKTKHRFREFFFCDIALFLYLSALISHKLGYGFDAFYCRFTFILVVFTYGIKIIWDILKKKNRKIFGPHFFWLIIFWIYAYSSNFWALDFSTVFNFNVNYIIQIFGISIISYYRMHDKNDYLTLLNILILANLYMSILMLIRVPSNGWGDERIGEFVGLHANAFGRNLALASIISVYLFYETRKKRYILLLPLFFFLILMSGSRAALLMFGIGIVGLMFLLSKKKTKYLYIFLITSLVILFINVTLTNDVLYDLVGYRFKGLLNYFTGDGNLDSSTAERQWFLEVANLLFSERPIFGVGLDNFKFYLSTLNYHHVTYSHSNHLELLSCLGLVGHTLYYSIFYIVFAKVLSNLKHEKIMKKFNIIIFLLLFIFGYVMIFYFDPYINCLIAFISCPILKFRNVNSNA